MIYGNWDRSLLSTVSTGYLVLLTYGVVQQLVSGQILTVNENLILLMFSTITYFVFSLFGWALIGIPLHFVFCKWLSPKYTYYLLACTCISCALLFVGSITGIYILIIAMFIQVILFRYYVFQTKKT